MIDYLDASDVTFVPTAARRIFSTRVEASHGGPEFDVEGR
jgi:hypothetical protein